MGCRFRGSSTREISLESSSFCQQARRSAGAIYCYFRSKHDLVEAISAERHSRDQALLSDLISAPSFSEGLDRVGKMLSQMLQDSKERQRRKVSIQFWAESLHDPRIRKVARRGMRQRGQLISAVRKAQGKGEIAKSFNADSLSRVMFALLQGFILQQAWEPEIDTPAYVATVGALLRLAFSAHDRNPVNKNHRLVPATTPQVN